MLVDIATTLREVLECWSLVYKQYTKVGFIETNPLRIFTYECCISPFSAVIYGKFADEVQCTMTCVADAGELPLDSCYGEELDRLRDEGKRLVEFCLFASRRRSPVEILDLICQVQQFARYCEYTDLVCCIHPNRASLYSKLYGMVELGPHKEYKKTNNQPATLMYLDLNSVNNVFYTHLKRFALQPNMLNYGSRFTFDPEFAEVKNLMHQCKEFIF